MLNKRLVGVVTVKDGWAVQSFGYQRYLPLGKPECLVENLDRWGADEIFIQVIDCSKNNVGPDIDLIQRITSKRLSTPLMYAGGIRSADDARTIVRAGIERVCIDSLLHREPAAIKDIAHSLGGQAVVASIPAVVNKDGVSAWFDYIEKTTKKLSDELLELIHDDYISELLIIDSCHEGIEQGFDFNLLSLVDTINTPLILFGGLSHTEQLKTAFLNEKVSAVAVGNFLSYREHEIQRIKNCLDTMPIRNPTYQYYDYKNCRY